jgi:crotonobetainyl-CoA:carnitine CoA-transferase CaiB-like acyl-CoA transferase
VEVLGNPVKFRGEPRGELRYPPPLGEHTGKILTNLLGLPSDHIAHVTADGVIYQGPG